MRTRSLLGRTSSPALLGTHVGTRAARSALVAGALLTIAAVPRAGAEEVIVKLGTMAPSGSTWHALLKEMGQKWKEASGGQVTLRIYPGGVVGNEGDMIRKTRIGQLQGAAVTALSLREITPEPAALAAPLIIQSYEELDYVLSKLGGKLEQALAAKGYVVLHWSDVGFVYLFSTKPLRASADARNHKVFVWDGDPAAIEGWKAAGFQPVVLSSTDLLPALQTGMIDTISTAPLHALTGRIFRQANKMLDMRWAILDGATVVRKDAWDKVPAELRPRLLQIARDYGRRIQLEVRKMNEQAIVQMKAQGLEVIPPADPSGFRKMAEAGNQVMRGKIAPAAFFDEVKRLAAEYRAGKR